MFKGWIIVVGLVLLVVPSLLSLEGLGPAAAVTLGLFLMAGLFWMLEPIPIYSTSMLVILFQLFFLSDAAPLVQHMGFPYAAAEAPKAARFMATLAHPILILFLGGFMLAAGAVKFSLEKNITRLLLAPFGGSPAKILLGIMLSTAFLSAFMSNTATTAMMMTVILPIVAGLSAEDRFRTGLALSVPVAANLGGIATPIGTPPNAVAIAALAREGVGVPFSIWMMMAVPLVVGSLGFAWWVLLKCFPPMIQRIQLHFEAEFDRSRPARLLYVVAGVTVILWITEKLHGIPSGVVAFLPVALLPALGVLDAKDIRGLSWEVLWLVGGGISLGLSLQDSGLAKWLIGLVNWGGMGPWVLLGGFLLLSILMANFLSHTVTATLLIPIAMSLAGSGALGGVGTTAALAIAIAIGSSYGMSLPISTPPNAIAVSTGLVKTPQMVAVGIVMAIFGSVAVLWCAGWFWPVFF